MLRGTRIALLPGFLALASSAPAQQRDQAPEARAEEQPAASVTDPENTFEFALSGDSLWGAYRRHLARANGHAAFGLLFGEDDDLALSARLVRFGEPVADTPLCLGVGLGLLGAAVDVSDEELFAVTLTGSADYGLDLDYPARIGLEASFAPDLATFADGEQVLDLLVRFELDLSSWATGFVGYRHYEVELDDQGDHDLDTSFHVGVRLGF